MTSERTCHFTGDDAWKCGTHCTCQHFNWNNKGQAAMTSELRPAMEVARDCYLRGSLPLAIDVIEADREAVRAEMSDAVVTAVSTAAETVTAALEELAKYKALAETLARALARCGRIVERHNWRQSEKVDDVKQIVAETLREYKEAHNV